ncbi:FHA domain-containing protein [Nocardioides sp.]|uniref:FHA domain-containing protein n=1 Tax=Nocardioides sp. TaxID=35761 RepID=UPI0039E468D1
MSSPHRCPAGHDSAAEDYCDVCGLAILAGATTSAPPVPDPVAESAQASTVAGDAQAAPATPVTAQCPSCQADNPANALFCEACGYDFTTGSLPRPAAPPTSTPAATPPSSPGEVAPPLPDGWVAEVWIDPDWYVDQASTDPLPSAGAPVVVALRATSILIGRTSQSRNIHPDLELGSDPGISRRHCQLTTDGTRWWVEDLGSSNGTYVGAAVGGLPTAPVQPGTKREIGPQECLFLGAWTRVVLRRATPGEI